MARDYRYFAANERTFLAWMRTAITVIAMGFALEKFEILSKHMVPAGEIARTHVGGGLIVMGVLLVIGGFWRFRGVQRDLLDETDDAYQSSKLITVLAMGLVISGIGLLAYLVV